MPVLNMNKDRLYVAVYPTAKKGEEYVRSHSSIAWLKIIISNPTFSYHWAFIITCKANNGVGEEGYRHHARNIAVIGWEYHTSILDDASSTLQLLARVLVAKVDDKKKLAEVFKNVEVKGSVAGWNCRAWAKAAWQAAVESGALSSNKKHTHLTWAQIEEKTKEYVAEKKLEGRYGTGQDMNAPKPTFDMLQDKETLE